MVALEIFGRKEKRLSMGVYPDVSLKAAREKRGAARQQLASSIDPGHARKAEKLAEAGGRASKLSRGSGTLSSRRGG